MNLPEDVIAKAREILELAATQIEEPGDSMKDWERYEDTKLELAEQQAGAGRELALMVLGEPDEAAESECQRKCCPHLFPHPAESCGSVE